MEECKYRLPCNWCDKFNKYCDMVEPIKIELPDPNKCDHDWKLETRYIYPSEDYKEMHYRGKYICRKCHTVEIRDLESK